VTVDVHAGLEQEPCGSLLTWCGVPEGSMTTLTLSVKHLPSDREQPCAVCAAPFVPLEDSGSRLFSMKAPEQEPFTALMCGGCYSKWSHGKTVVVRGSAPG
jgi:hypothetical protein